MYLRVERTTRRCRSIFRYIIITFTPVILFLSRENVVFLFIVRVHIVFVLFPLFSFPLSNVVLRCTPYIVTVCKRRVCPIATMRETLRLAAVFAEKRKRI